MKLFGRKNVKEKAPEKSAAESVPTGINRPGNAGRLESASGGEKSESARAPKTINARSYQAILSPHLTEKAGLMGNLNKYVFKVSKDVGKIEVRKAIEEIYQVKVKKVVMLLMPSKARRIGRQEGQKPGFKKAVVTLREGNKIEITG